nr:MAG TPA: hypothetical protein [Caudoviricetes sp.]
MIRLMMQNILHYILGLSILYIYFLKYYLFLVYILQILLCLYF